ncbi:MAG TPA: DciA family protein [Sporichthya sp.]|nr:DciA family protein [Sporichthya sp.]
MSADAPTPNGASPEESNSGIDLARSALAEARAAARERVRKPGATRSPRPERGGTARDGRDPQTFGAALQNLITERGWEVPAAVGDAMDRWATIVGSDIATHAEPLSFEAGVLAVQASSTAWATQLRLLAPDIVRRLNAELGHGTVLRIEVKAPSGPSWRKGRLRVQDGRGPRDTYG